MSARSYAARLMSQSPVRKLEREAMVGSFAEAVPTDGRSSLQNAQACIVMKDNTSKQQGSTA